jgi:phospholipid N-methyltransferase
LVRLKNGVFWDVTSRDSCKSRRFVETYHVFLHSMLQLLVIANIVPSSSIVVTLMMEAIRSSETSVVNKVHTA